MGVIIIGAGGHGKVVADILQLQNVPIKGFLDDEPTTWNTMVLGLPVLGPIDQYREFAPDGLIMGIGSNSLREQIVELLEPGAINLWMNAIHPTATVARSVELGCGVVMAAHTVVNPDAKIGNHVVVNTGATVDHDCIIGDYSHIAPGVHLAGNTRIGTGVLLGIGSQTIPNCCIADYAIIGAGATVVDNVPANVIAIGTPARW
jgi:sugar O-acyltransferase (sialic acid O-acetyltransferase NeuD family)